MSAALVPVALKAHSDTGASGAHRWFPCPGSVALSAGLPNKSSPYASLGTAAHSLGALCLTDGSDAWEHLGEKITAEGTEFTVDTEMVESVQLYLDTIRGDIAKYKADFGNYDEAVKLDPTIAPVVWIEERFHLADVDPGLYGTADCAVYFPHWRKLNVYDYKHGIGVGVEAKENPQLQYYAVGAVSKLPETAELRDIECILVQPRHDHESGSVRRWTTNFDALGEWIGATLKPALLATRKPDAPLVAGEWCRFCPAKAAGVCPVLNATFDGIAKTAEEPGEFEPPAALETWELAERASKIELAKFVIKALEDEIYSRLLKGETIPGFKLVPKKSNRVWKEGAQEAVVAAVGNAAWKEPAFRSPAEVEKLQDGAAVVAKWAYKPDTGYTVAPDADRRHAVSVATPAQRFAGVDTGKAAK